MNRQRMLKTPIAMLAMLGALSASAAPSSDNSSGPRGVDSPPDLMFTADQTSYVIGQAATLRWSSANTRFCSASGDWSGKVATEGSYRTAALDGPRSYTLKCSAPGGGVSQTLDLTVAESAPTSPTSPDTVPDSSTSPTLTFAATEAVLPNGGLATLTWAADNASGCTASGGWTGVKPISGSEVLGPLYASTSFTLACDAGSTSVVETVHVDVMGAVTLSWQPPAENVDGSALTDLAGFQIYYGTTSRDYGSSVRISDSRTTSHTLALPSGTYYLAMTALDRDGNESGFSNEIQRIVP